MQLLLRSRYLVCGLRGRERDLRRNRRPHSTIALAGARVAAPHCDGLPEQEGQLALRRARGGGCSSSPTAGSRCRRRVRPDRWLERRRQPPSLECFTSQELTKIDVSHNELGALPAEMATLSCFRPSRAALRAVPARLKTGAANPRPAAQRARQRGWTRCSRSASSTSRTTTFGELDRCLRPRPAARVHNRLATLPALPECLSSIAVEHNELRELPPLPSTLANCEVAHNKLASIDCRRAPQLALLDARECAARRADAASQTVSKQPATRALLLSFNKLEALALPPLPALVELHAQSAGLRKLDDSGLAPLLALRVLDVSNNELGELPAVLGYRPKLDRVIADGNPLRSIKRTLWQSGQGYLGTHALKKYLRTRGPPPAGSGYRTRRMTAAAATCAGDARRGRRAGGGARGGVGRPHPRRERARPRRAPSRQTARAALRPAGTD